LHKNPPFQQYKQIAKECLPKKKDAIFYAKKGAWPFYSILASAA